MESRRTFIKKSSLAAAALVALPSVASGLSISTIRARSPMKSNNLKTVTVLWYSQTGNTQKCGKVLAKTFEEMGIKTIYGDLRDYNHVNISDTDLIVIGSPVFYYDIPELVKDFIRSLPDITGIPVAGFVAFGGPEGNQDNAGCSILEGLISKNGVPVGLNTFMTSKSYPPSFETYAKDLKAKKATLLPDKNTYRKIREYAEHIKAQVEKGATSVFKRNLTLRECATHLGLAWWTKQLIKNHYIIEDECIKCGTCAEKCPTNSIDVDTPSVNTDSCVMCFGCLNNCRYQAMNMEYSGKKLIGYYEFLKEENYRSKVTDELTS